MLAPLELLMTFDLAHKRGWCVYAEETRKDRNTKFCSTHRQLHIGRGERGGYDLLKGRLISWVNPRFFCAGAALDSKVKRSQVKN